MTDPNFSEASSEELLVLRLRDDDDTTVIRLTSERELICDDESRQQMNEDQARVLGALMLNPDTWLTPKDLLAKNQAPNMAETRRLRHIVRQLAQTSKVLNRHITQGNENKDVQYALSTVIKDNKPSVAPRQRDAAPSTSRPSFAQISQELDAKSEAIMRASPKPKASRIRKFEIPSRFLDTSTIPEPQPEPVKPPEPPKEKVSTRSETRQKLVAADMRHIVILAERAKKNLQPLDQLASEPDSSLLDKWQPLDLIIADIIYHGPHGLPIGSRGVWQEIIREVSLVAYTEEHFQRAWEAFIDQVPNNVLLANRVHIVTRRNAQTGAKERGLIWAPRKSI
jgi:hypothetical protein